MPEHERHDHGTTAEHDPFWSEDIALCDASLRFYRHQPTAIRARVHTATERYRSTDVRQEIVPLTRVAGERSYVLMKPYVPEPDVRLTVGLFPTPQADGAIGRVLDAQQHGMRRREVGHIQAWHYPLDRTLVLWECYLHEPFRDAPLLEDTAMYGLWSATEEWLIRRFPQTNRLVTTAYDPLFETKEYQTFLTRLGYQPVARAAYGKEVTSR